MLLVIRLSQLQRKFSILALLLLCLSGSLWLQGEHLHINDTGPVHDCALCHHGVAALSAITPLLPVDWGNYPLPISPTCSASIASLVALPPVRGPPVLFVS